MDRLSMLGLRSMVEGASGCNAAWDEAGGTIDGEDCALVGVRISLLMSSSRDVTEGCGCRTGASTGAGVKSIPDRRSRLEDCFVRGAAGG